MADEQSKRKTDLKELRKQLEAKRAAYRKANPEVANRVICPFTDDMKCIGGCTSNRERACV